MATFWRQVSRSDTRHLWVGGAGLLAVGWFAKTAVWGVVRARVVETTEVEQADARAAYGKHNVFLPHMHRGSRTACLCLGAWFPETARQDADRFKIPAAYFEGLDMKKTREEGQQKPDH